MKCLVAILLLTAALPVDARSRAVVRRFIKENPRPAWCAPPAKCVVDHIWPLCAGGADAPENMQWQEYQQSLTKDALERQVCRLIIQLDACENHTPAERG